MFKVGGQKEDKTEEILRNHGLLPTGAEAEMENV